jgi:hypothetical protein
MPRVTGIAFAHPSGWQRGDNRPPPGVGLIGRKPVFFSGIGCSGFDSPT